MKMIINKQYLLKKESTKMGLYKIYKDTRYLLLEIIQ